VIAGEGYERPALEDLIRRSGADSWISLPGYVPEEELIELYRRAWVVASTSLREGWGMTITEAGACGTPSVASRISGHQDAVVDGTTGILVDGPDDLITGLDTLLSDHALRNRLGLAALEHSSHFTWDATARGALAALGAEALFRSQSA
jgi:glycosyltransferase involved in cell wall biosynthesis